MVQFQCPRCKAVLKAPDDMAGQKIECVKCQQRLLVPATAWTGSAAGPPARQIPHTVENDSHQPGISKVVSAIGSFVRGSFYGYLLVFCVVLVAGIVLALLYASGKWTVDFANGKQSEQGRGQSSGRSTSEPEQGRDSQRSP